MSCARTRLSSVAIAHRQRQIAQQSKTLAELLDRLRCKLARSAAAFAISRWRILTQCKKAHRSISSAIGTATETRRSAICSVSLSTWQTWSRPLDLVSSLRATASACSLYSRAPIFWITQLARSRYSIATTHSLDKSTTINFRFRIVFCSSRATQIPLSIF